MSADEILMDGVSALGPIDAQIQYEGKQFSAEALLKGFDKIKEEADATKSLNRAYIPLLQRISPGDLQHAQNALDFAKVLVTNWLCTYKFKNWTTHRTHNPGTPVTDEEKRRRAQTIASDLCDHSRWLTHGRSIRLEDLHGLGIEVTDFSHDKALAESIRRYYTLLQMTFSTTGIYKIMETPNSQIIRMMQTSISGPGIPQGANVEGLLAEVQCTNCKKMHKLQIDFDKIKPLQPGTVHFPSNDFLICDKCKNVMNLIQMRQQIEMQTKRQVAKK